MGGIIILMGILIPTLLFADLNKVYIRLILLVPFGWVLWFHRRLPEAEGKEDGSKRRGTL